MSIADLGSIGELIAAIATVVTLGYLAYQVRQNTRALKASTFQGISAEMGQNVLPIMLGEDMAEVYVLSLTDPEAMSPEQRIKLQAMLSSSCRRLEAVYVQTELGSIDRELVAGFEKSIASIMKAPFARTWWEAASVNFYPPFVAHLGELMTTEEIAAGNPAFDPRSDTSP